MKTSRYFSRTIVAVASIGILIACAQNPSMEQVTASSKYSKDSAYMNKVDRAARARNTNVLWVNPPTKRPTTDSNDES